MTDDFQSLQSILFNLDMKRSSDLEKRASSNLEEVESEDIILGLLDGFFLGLNNSEDGFRDPVKPLSVKDLSVLHRTDIP